MGNLGQEIDPTSLFAQQDATRVPDMGQMIDTPTLIQMLVRTAVDASNDPSRNIGATPLGEKPDINVEQISEVAADFAPGIGDVKALAVDAPEQFGSGQNVAGIISIFSALPGIGFLGDLLKKLPQGATRTSASLETPPLQQLVPEPSTAARLGQGDVPIAAQAQNRRLAERTGSIPAPAGSEAVEANVRVLAKRPEVAAPSQLFQGIEGLDKQGLAVFAKPIDKNTRQIVSLTPNPKQPGGWKATIFEEVEGKGQTLLNTSDFNSHAEALEALRGGHRFFEDFTEIPIGSAESMEEFFRGLL